MRHCFQFEGNNVDVIGPIYALYFKSIDVCKILEFTGKNGQRAVRALDDECLSFSELLDRYSNIPRVSNDKPHALYLPISTVRSLLYVRRTEKAKHLRMLLDKFEHTIIRNVYDAESTKAITLSNRLSIADKDINQLMKYKCKIDLIEEDYIDRKREIADEYKSEITELKYTIDVLKKREETYNKRIRKILSKCPDRIELAKRDPDFEYGDPFRSYDEQQHNVRYKGKPTARNKKCIDEREESFHRNMLLLENLVSTASRWKEKFNRAEMKQLRTEYKLKFKEAHAEIDDMKSKLRDVDFFWENKDLIDKYCRYGNKYPFWKYYDDKLENYDDNEILSLKN